MKIISFGNGPRRLKTCQIVIVNELGVSFTKHLHHISGNTYKDKDGKQYECPGRPD